MTFALSIPRRGHILSMLETGLTGIVVVLILTSVAMVAHSGLLLVE